MNEIYERKRIKNMAVWRVFVTEPGAPHYVYLIGSYYLAMASKCAAYISVVETVIHFGITSVLRRTFRLRGLRRL